MTTGARYFILIVLLALLPACIYWDTITSMSRQWSMSSYRHCALIPLVSLFWLWRDRQAYSTFPLTGSWAGAALLAGLVLMWVVADATSIQVITHVSVVLMSSALVLTIFGWRAYAAVWFPLAFLLFAVPVGDGIMPYLMDITASLVTLALRTIGIPALREGMVVTLPGGTFEVVEACSGFQYLNAGVALGVLVAQLMFKSFLRQLLYVAAVAVVFIAINVLRAFVIMLVGTESNMRYLVGPEHVYFGWVLFLVGTVAMYSLAEKYSDRQGLRRGHAFE